MSKKKFDRNVLVSFFLRAGLAVVFLYAGIASLISPENWVGFIPQFIQNNFPASILLILFSIYEISIGLWLLSNKKIFYASIVSSATIFLIIIFNFSVFDVVFRDIAILLMAISLVILSKGEK